MREIIKELFAIDEVLIFGIPMLIGLVIGIVFCITHPNYGKDQRHHDDSEIQIVVWQSRPPKKSDPMPKPPYMYTRSDKSDPPKRRR